MVAMGEMEAGGNDVHGNFWYDVIFMARSRSLDYDVWRLKGECELRVEC